MRRNETQIKEELYEAVFDPKVYNKASITRKTRLHIRTIKKHLPAVLDEMRADLDYLIEFRRGE